ncbi:MAG TPA: Hsp20/alpha crystallin family protein [Opitutaceae bacterium]|nr:Hsp20/alpha crystallin family protein [Opitutaceae bacterium]
MSLLQSIVPSFVRSPAQRPGEIDIVESVRPVYEVKETPEAYGLTVYLPGVNKDGLEITVDHELVSIKGNRSWVAPSSWTSLYRESTSAPFVLNLSHDHAVDADKVQAELKDGILRVSLPKTEALKPRKVAVS